MIRTILDRGDVTLLSFDPTLGHEQAGFSPAVGLSPEYYNKASGLSLVWPITTNIRGYPFEVILDCAKKTTGVALSDQVHSIDWQAGTIKTVDRISTTCSQFSPNSSRFCSELSFPRR